MVTITIKKREYQELLDTKLKFEYVRQILETDLFAPPPSRKPADIVSAFRATKRYNKKFLASLHKGLKRSSYFRS